MEQQNATTNHSKEYKEKVIDFLKKGKANCTYTLNLICEKANQPHFIEIVKQYMNNTAFAGGWEFNSDYSKLKRLDIDFTPKKTDRNIYK